MKSKTKLTNSIFAVVMLAIAKFATAITYNPADDFSDDMNPNLPWTFGYTDSLGAELVVYDATKTGDGVDYWHRSDHFNAPFPPEVGHNPGLAFVQMPDNIEWAENGFHLHPGPEGSFSVARWTAPTSGTYAVDALFTMADDGATDVYVLHNSESIFEDQIVGRADSRSFAMLLDVIAGDTIDFSVGYAGDYTNDSTDLVANIATPELTVTSAVSSKQQRSNNGGGGIFSLPLALSPAGNGTVEPRSGGPTRVVFSFSSDIRAADGTISGNEFTITNATFFSASIAANTLTLILTGPVDQSVVKIELNGIEDTTDTLLTGDTDVEIRALVGDANQDRIVDKNDFTATKAHAGETLDQTSGNYLFDMSLNGKIDRVDWGLANTNRGHTVP